LLVGKAGFIDISFSVDLNQLCPIEMPYWAKILSLSL